MSSQNLGQYQLDLTGVNPDNFVDAESYTLIRQRNRAIALTHGAFFTESLKIVHVDTNYELQKNTDYKILQPYSTLIAATGKSVAGIILIHNSNIHQNLAISYQTVGSAYGLDSKELENYLNSISDQGTTFSWYNSILEDQSFEGEIEKIDKFDFHWLCFTLEKVRNAIIWSDSEYYDKIRQYLDSVMESIEIQTKLALDHYLTTQFESFKSSVTKFSIGLDNINNVGTASASDAIQASDPNTRITDFQNNKYVTLQALAIFKEQIYEKFASVKTTNLGLNRGVVIHPTIETVLGMVNGSIYILKSKKENADSGLSYEASIYPPDSELDEEYTVVKISNNTTNIGGLYLYSERNGKSLYLASHSNGNPNLPFIWNRLITKEDTTSISSNIADHLLDRNNPHKTTKEIIGFKDLENLPVVTSNEVMALQACKKYVTMDALLLFTKTYLVSEDAAAQDPRNEDKDSVQIIYTAQAEDKCLPPDCPCPETTAPPPPPPPPPPAESPLLLKLNQFVNSIINTSVEIAPNTTYEDYFTRVSNDYPAFSVIGEYGYSNGSGGYSQKFLQVMKKDSLCAGYHPGDIYVKIADINDFSVTPGVNGTYVDIGSVFKPLLKIEPDELYKNKEYVASIKMPGRVIHNIRGVFDNDGIAKLPEEMFGWEDHHTGAANYVATDIPYIATASPYNNYADRRNSFTQNDLANTKTVGFCRVGSFIDYYATVPMVTYVTLNKHEVISPLTITADITIYNVLMYFDPETQAYIIDNGGFSFVFEHFPTIDGPGYQIPDASYEVQNGKEVYLDTTNVYGVGTYRQTFSFPISSLPYGENIIRMTIIPNDGSPNVTSHFMLINKIQVTSSLDKTIPVFINGVEEGTMNIVRYSDDQKLIIFPFKSNKELPAGTLSNVYFFEKDVEESQDAHVFLVDVYKEETEFYKAQSIDINSFLNEGYYNINSENSLTYMSIAEFKQLITNLDIYKKKYQHIDKNRFVMQVSETTISEADFNSITKVRVVPYQDSDYACTIPIELIPPVDEVIQVPTD